MKTGNQDWLIISDASIVNLLMKFTSEICDFENHSICELENGYSNFVNMILLARRYNMIIENIGLMHGKDVQLTGQDATKRVTKQELDDQIAKVEVLLHRQKDPAYG